jgi:hypothetical protein
MIKFKHYPAAALKEMGMVLKCAGITFCYEYDHEKSLLSFAMTQCSHKDNYVRKEGRDQSLDKFLSKEPGHKLTIYMSKKAYRTKRHNFFTDMAYNFITQAY